LVERLNQAYKYAGFDLLAWFWVNYKPLEQISNKKEKISETGRNQMTVQHP
jgi:hypothetical protein